MALGTPTTPTAAVHTTSSQTVVSGSFTPTANALLICHVNGQNGTAPSVPTISDSGGLTWTLITSSGGTFNSTNRCVSVWAIAPASPSAITVQADWGASITGSCLALVQITGADATTPILAGSTAGTSGSSTTPAPGTVPAITVGNVQLLMVATRAASSSPESGAWTELYDHSTGGACAVAGYYSTAGDTSPTSTTSSAPWRAVAFEVAVAASGGVGPDLIRSIGPRVRRPSASLW